MPLFLKIIIAFLPFIREIVIQSADTKKEKNLRTIILGLVLFILVVGTFAIPHGFKLVSKLYGPSVSDTQAQIERLQSDNKRLKITYDFLVDQMAIVNGEYLNERARANDLVQDIEDLKLKCIGPSGNPKKPKLNTDVYRRLNSLKSST